MARRTEINDAGDLRPAMGRTIKFRKEVEEDVADTMHAMVAHFETEAVKNAPVGATGDLKDSIFGEVRERPGTIVGRVGTPIRHGMPVEYGTGPQGRLGRSRKAPPSSALHEWVRKKIGITDEQEIRSVSYLIARAIGRRGTKPQPFMREAYVSMRKKFRQAVAQTKRIAGRVW
ncbi:MAG: HK97 gp10 family phage protein [Gemmatimonadetes bacterium]|nr:HK97 gp10 family phage protein [Gemmatimonadota bacterium]MYF79158.1 HK97 gp10 family phage protein [Chloroflexota bacterium]